MAENSGTFKTNPRNPSRFRRIVTIFQRPSREVSGAGKHVSSDSRTFAPFFLNNRARRLAVLTEPDSLREISFPKRSGGRCCEQRTTNLP
jgi:hypothetical protein